MQNVAESTIEYYSHVDFKENYAFCLLEDQTDAIDRIIQIAGSYDMEMVYGAKFKLTRNEAEMVLEYIMDNMEDFVEDFNGFYVGYFCIDSITYGEQCEQLTGIWNAETGKEFPLEEMQKQFDQAGFYIDGEYAYYDPYGGLKVDLKPQLIPMLAEKLPIEARLD